MDTREIMIKAVHALLSSGSYDDLNEEQNSVVVEFETEIMKEKVDELASKPRYIFVTNFKEILAFDTRTKDTLSIPFERLPQKFEFFLAWNGIEKADFDKENPADVRAAERFAKLYDVIVKDNPHASRKGLNLFLIRVLFCLFAEDTDIFEKNLFTNRLKQLTQLDGSDVDDFISELFGVLDVEKKDRPANTPSWLADFPYVDGDLFKDLHESLKFTAKSRKIIMGNLISSVSANLLVIHSSKSYTGYLEISSVSARGLVCSLSCLNPIIESLPVSTARSVVIEKK